MNFIRQRLVTLRNRARDLQTSLRRWALYNDAVSQEMKGDLLARFTPGEQASFESNQDLTRPRLRPASVQLQTLATWYDYVLERINEQLARARTVLDQGRHQECMSILNDVEHRMLNPNAETLNYAFRALAQRAAHESHLKIAAIDAVLRELYLPTMKLAHQRGIVSKEALARTPLAYFADAADGPWSWRRHALAALANGRRVPISLMGVPRRLESAPWNLVALGHDVGWQVYADLELSWEIANKLQTESINAGVSTQTAAVWCRWHETLFADVFGVLKLGPAYVSGMIELLGTDVRSALATAPTAPVPPAYVRWHLMLQTLQLLNFPEEARERFNQLHLLCGDPNQLAQQFGPVWLQLVHECRAVAGLIAFSPCRKLGGARVIDVVPPFLTTESQTARRIKDILLAGDESCASDENFSWCESLSGAPAHLAVAGLRTAYDCTAEFEASQRLWIRFWCLMQFLTAGTESTRTREDREFAPGDAALRSLAQQSMLATA